MELGVKVEPAHLTHTENLSIVKRFELRSDRTGDKVEEALAKSMFSIPLRRPLSLCRHCQARLVRLQHSSAAHAEVSLAPDVDDDLGSQRRYSAVRDFSERQQQSQESPEPTEVPTYPQPRPRMQRNSKSVQQDGAQRITNSGAARRDPAAKNRNLEQRRQNTFYKAGLADPSKIFQFMKTERPKSGHNVVDRASSSASLGPVKEDHLYENSIKRVAKVLPVFLDSVYFLTPRLLIYVQQSYLP